MIEMIKANVLLPATTRMGSLAAGGLVTLGMTQPHADAVGLGLAALLGFGVDLVLAWYRKRTIQHKATEEAFAEAERLVERKFGPLVANDIHDPRFGAPNG